MHIPHDIVDLIVDQLSLSGDGDPGYLQATSLVSTVWVNRSQHHIFSTLELGDSSKIKRWCSRVKPDPYGVSRHVRVLIVGWRDRPRSPTEPPLIASDIEFAHPHFTSLNNLQEFILGRTYLMDTPLNVLSPIFSSSAGTLERLRWTNCRADIPKTWEDIRTLANLLPNLTYVDLSGYLDIDGGTKARFSADEGHSPAIRRFAFHELQIADVTLLSLPLFEFCGPHLQVLDLQAFEMDKPSKR